MITEIRVPKLGMTQSDITVVEITKADKDPVREGEKVAVIETAKVAYDIQAPASGLIFYRVRVKDRVQIGDLLAVVADSAESFEQSSNRLTRRPESDDDSPPSSLEDRGAPEGLRISFEDETPAPPPISPPPPPAQPALEGRKILKRIPFIGMRRTIADNLVASLQAGAQLTIVTEADMTRLSRFRDELILDHPETRITFVDMLVKILAFTLKEFPIVNSTLVGDEIICWDEVHIGVAVALEEGLVVPVVRDADRKSLVGISREIKKLSKKARSRQLDPACYQGGTFTLSSGGKVETDIITPIINPPQNAILALGKIGPRPAVHQGTLAVRTMTHLCLTHDHRVIDGVPASMFLGRVKEIIQNADLFSKVLR